MLLAIEKYWTMRGYRKRYLSGTELNVFVLKCGRGHKLNMKINAIRKFNRL